MPLVFPASPMPLAAASRPTPWPSWQKTWNIMSTWLERQASALVEHPRLLRQDVEVEPEPVPGEDGVAGFGLLFQSTGPGRQPPPGSSGPWAIARSVPPCQSVGWSASARRVAAQEMPEGAAAISSPRRRR